MWNGTIYYCSRIIKKDERQMESNGNRAFQLNSEQSIFGIIISR